MAAKVITEEFEKWWTPGRVERYAKNISAAAFAAGWHARDGAAQHVAEAAAQEPCPECFRPLADGHCLNAHCSWDGGAA